MSLTVQGDLVKRKDMIWIYIGDGSAPEDQIVYQNGRFRLRKAEWAAKPVVTRHLAGCAGVCSLSMASGCRPSMNGNCCRHSLPIRARCSMHCLKNLTDGSYNAHLEMMKKFSNDTPPAACRRSSGDQRMVEREKPMAVPSSRVVTSADDGQAQTPALRYPWEELQRCRFSHRNGCCRAGGFQALNRLWFFVCSFNHVTVRQTALLRTACLRAVFRWYGLH